MGYTKSSMTSPPLDKTIFFESMPELRGSIYLTLCVSLEPIMEIYKFSTSQLECTELANVKVCLINVMLKKI